MLDTVTRLNFAIPASRRASSNEVSLSLWVPTPLVKKTFLGTRLVNSMQNKLRSGLIFYLFFRFFKKREFYRQVFNRRVGISSHGSF